MECQRKIDRQKRLSTGLCVSRVEISRDFLNFAQTTLRSAFCPVNFFAPAPSFVRGGLKNWKLSYTRANHVEGIVPDFGEDTGDVMRESGAIVIARRSPCREKAPVQTTHLKSQAHARKSKS
jgi:hypothetical protein